jgi:hypothetical protein
MKTKLSISLAIAALSCLAVWTAYAQTTRQAWTYHVVAVPPGDTARAERELNQEAAGGWELIAVNGGNWYFRRGR